MAEVGSPEWVLGMGEQEQLAWYIAILESRGAEWDYKAMAWAEPVPPKTVYAILAEGAQ